MSLEQLIEDDMVRFLESEARSEKKEPIIRLEEEYHVRRDWENEVHQQLKRNDVAAAKRIFNELKHHYEEIPRTHHTERRHMYETLQNCYLAIVNAVQDHARTQILLQRMETSQDDVFDAHVKPINLQAMQRSTSISMPEQEPFTKQAPPPAKTNDLTLPPPPLEEVVHAPKTPSSNDVLASCKEQFTSILNTAKQDPHVAHHLIGQTRSMLEKAPLPPQQKEALLRKLHALETAVHAYDAKLHFEQRFAQAQKELLAASPEDAPRLHEELLRRAQSFENAFPEYAGRFTGPLHQVKSSRGLYTEDELLAQLTPTLSKIKTAMRKRHKRMFVEGIAELERFTLALPQGNHRSLLEHAVTVLKAKAQKAVDIYAQVQPLLLQLRSAKKQKDAVRLRAAFEDLRSFTAQLPHSSERTLLERTLRQLHAQKEVKA